MGWGKFGDLERWLCFGCWLRGLGLVLCKEGLAIGLVVAFWARWGWEGIWKGERGCVGEKGLREGPSMVERRKACLLLRASGNTGVGR